MKLVLKQKKFLKLSIKSFTTENKVSRNLKEERFEIYSSIPKWTDLNIIDSHFVVEDIFGSLAQISMLGKQKIIPWEKCSKILPTLLQFQDDYIDNKWILQNENKNIHFNIEEKLVHTLGMDIGDYMHASRSTNDQIVLQSRLYTRKKLLDLRNLIIKATEAFLNRAEKGKEDVMPSYIDFQHSQPISVAYWVSHWAAAFIRDLGRFKHAYDTTDENPLGSGAIAGSSLNIDRMLTTNLLGFQKVMEHGMDCVSSRDYFLETTSSIAIYYSTCSRLAEELILWSSYEFQTITLDDNFFIRNSTIPDKNNPEILELIRGRSGRVNGLANAALTMMKGVPSGYNRDFHEDKEITLEIFDIASRMTETLPSLVEYTKFNLKRMVDLAGKNFSTANELSNYLVLVHNIPYAESHYIVSSLVGELVKTGKNFDELQYCYEFIKNKNINVSIEDIKRVIDAKSVMMSYNALGSTGPMAITNTINNLRNALEEHKNILYKDQLRVTFSHMATRQIAREIGNAKNYNEYSEIIDRNKPNKD